MGKLTTYIKITFGTLMTASGFAVHAWLLLAAETTGRGLQLGVMVLDNNIPAMIPAMLGIILIINGLSVVYGSRKQRSSGSSPALINQTSD